LVPTYNGQWKRGDKEEVIGAILLALPIVGITDTNLAIDKAVETMESQKEVEKVAAAH
jgi:hypothetical protein